MCIPAVSRAFICRSIRPRRRQRRAVHRACRLAEEAWLRARGIEANWPVQWIPERLHLDNAQGVSLRGAEAGLRTARHRHRLPAGAHAALWRHIERLIGTMMGKVHLLPGTTFSDVRAKGDSDPEKTAAMTLDEAGALARPRDRRRLSPQCASRASASTPLGGLAAGHYGRWTTPGRGEPDAGSRSPPLPDRLSAAGTASGSARWRVRCTRSAIGRTCCAAGSANRRR